MSAVTITYTNAAERGERFHIHRQSDVRRYRDRKGQGLCVKCGVARAVEGRTRCQPCADHCNRIAKSQPSYPRGYVPGTSVNKRGDKRGLNPKPHGARHVVDLPPHSDRSDVCAICGDPPSKGRKLAVDHCHATGVTRGFLCSRCNMGLGYFKDDPTRMASAIAYLARWVLVQKELKAGRTLIGAQSNTDL